MANQNLDFNRELFGRYIAKRLRERREELGITLVDLATKLGVKHPTITSLLNWRAIASVQKYEEVAKKLGFTEAQFRSLLEEARKAELESHGLQVSTTEDLNMEQIDAAFMANHNIPDAKKRDLMRLLKVLKEEDE